MYDSISMTITNCTNNLFKVFFSLFLGESLFLFKKLSEFSAF